jgi:cytochrome c553
MRRRIPALRAWLVAAVYAAVSSWIYVGVYAGVYAVALLGVCGTAHVVRAEAVTGSPEGTLARAEDLEFFESQVRPLLVEHCAECHSAKAGDPEGGLSFDSRVDFRSAEGVAIAGKPDESLLVKVVRYDGDLQMPPDGKLPAAAIQTIEEWVRRGLPWPDDGKAAGTAKTGVEAFDIAKRKAEHWCWHPPRVAPPPAVRNAAWCTSDIDRFVLARLEAAGLEPAAAASRETLVRRAAEILTGLPALPADVARVTGDPDPHAFDRYVDQLLASPHYGERFARHWLDVARYGETRGHEFDYTIPNAWRYRDWVVKAFNDDLPYDQFVREQIAGDLMERPRVDAKTGANESVVGTGFWFLGEAVHGPVDIAQDEADRMDNCIDTFGKAFLGLAMGCARCHDHKFDAISNEDYYALSGMLMSSSYRQVPFETLEANRKVARRLDAADADARRRLLPLIAAAVGPDGDSLARGLPEPADAPPVPGETVIADYTRGENSTPIIGDGAAWGQAAVPAGAPLLLPAVEGLPRELRVEPLGHARSDAIWSATRSTGERDTPPLGDVDRAGRVLRTPKVLIKEGVIWHHVRGHVHIFVVVDGHLLLQGGPIYKSHLMTADTGGDWQWIRQDLRKDLTWESGRVVHVEYAAIEGAVSVAETVAAVEQPKRNDPPLPAAVNRRLADAGFDWNAPAVKRAVDEAVAVAATRDAILADVKLESATAPAILDGNGIDQYVLLKGSAARRGELSPRRFLEAIDGPGQPQWPSQSSGRRELADRVLDPANPLTGRVIVNRIWHHLFGRGLVPTTDNFGKLGEAAADPVAQALLDTLAVRFREEGWSVKRLVKEIVTTSTWRMAGSRDPRALEKDPLNLLLHHYPLRRLEGEAVRDKILAVSGRLDRTVGGPSVEVFLTEFHDGRGKPKSGPLDGAGRRSIYTRIRRNFLPSFLLAFDMPVPFQAMGRRSVTNVPAQSLTLMNDPFVREEASLWAKQTLRDESLPPEDRIERMYREAFARGPTAAERAAAIEFLTTQAAKHGVALADEPRHEATWADLAHALITTKEFIFVP